MRKPLIGAELDGTVFADLASSDFVQNIANPIVRAFGYYVERPDVYPVLNLLQGANSRDAINHFHFDATFLTLAVPVFMPELTTAQRGSFLLWPNVRQFSTSRLLEKLFWRLMKTPWLRDRFRRETVDFSPGSLYFFYGFRSWHGTGDMDLSSFRANCLLNVGGPFFHKDKNRAMIPSSQRVEP